MTGVNSKERFSSRVENYVKYRPTYPPEVINNLIAKTGLNEGSLVADIGSGTGKFTRALLERGISVVAIEPNKNMRSAAERDLSGFPGFRSVSASAEETGLRTDSVDLITAAQAFHWFDHAACKIEFRRILKPGGSVCLIWNRRETTPEFMKEYDKVITRLHMQKPSKEHHRINSAVFNDFFDGDFETKEFFWRQTLDLEGLWGRSQSSSYAPTPDHPNYEPLKDALQDLFKRYSTNGVVRFDYRTEMTIGHL
ncbi:MAG: class I SAM-dependent methyltransferase [Oscillospiraceae bacterium]|jgi:SAM-dependent methyltransferase|nr:class I SAM-dependent methyltransferase [Oscillospiraceae bacterium]